MKSQIFRRVESKYLITQSQFKKILSKCKNYLEKDIYYKSEVLNIYFDTDNFELIRTSLGKPIYKEKVRLRSYKIPNDEDEVFLEIKKKYDGVVGKRRISLTLKEFKDYYFNHKNIKDTQIMKEIDYCFKKYNLKPQFFLSYERLSYRCKNDENFRITFDYNIKERCENLKLEDGIYGTNIISNKEYIMEIKSLECMPIWLCNILSEYKIYPTSFSKYGTAYNKKLKEGVINV